MRELTQRLFSVEDRSFLNIVEEKSVDVRTDGQRLPILIFSPASRPDVAELVRLHRYASSRDVDCRWGVVDDATENIVLHLTFRWPAKLEVTIRFRLGSNGELVDRIISSEGFYLRPANANDEKQRNNAGVPAIHIELPNTGFGPAWNRLWQRSLTKQYRNKGLKPQEARRAANRFIWAQRKCGS